MSNNEKMHASCGAPRENQTTSPGWIRIHMRNAIKTPAGHLGAQFPRNDAALHFRG